jgi:hypothetical protein
MALFKRNIDHPEIVQLTREIDLIHIDKEALRLFNKLQRVAVLHKKLKSFHEKTGQSTLQLNSNTLKLQTTKNQSLSLSEEGEILHADFNRGFTEDLDHLLRD